MEQYQYTRQDQQGHETGTYFTINSLECFNCKDVLYCFTVDVFVSCINAQGGRDRNKRGRKILKLSITSN